MAANVVPDPRTDDTVAAVQAKSAIDWDKAREWWSFRPLIAPAVPEVKDRAWPANAIDRFSARILDLQVIQEASTRDELTQAGERLARLLQQRRA